LYGAEKKAFIILLIASISLFIILIGFFAAILKQFRRNRILFEEKINAEMTGREEERKRISKDLHDELGATITGAKMYLESFQGNSEHDKLSVFRAHAGISKCLDLIKQIMNDLYPVSLDNYGLVSCLNEFIEEINLTDKINIIFLNTVEDLELKILKKHKIHIFRIINEIIQNTLKHSDSKVLSIRISESKNFILIDTIDQGVGFDGNDDCIRKRGHGIKNIINRVELIGGLIYLDARPEKGVQFTIEIPISNAKS
jgi:signal transduction histidine kinase